MTEGLGATNFGRYRRRYVPAIHAGQFGTAEVPEQFCLAVGRTDRYATGRLAHHADRDPGQPRYQGEAASGGAEFGTRR